MFTAGCGESTAEMPAKAAVSMTVVVAAKAKADAPARAPPLIPIAPRASGTRMSDATKAAVATAEPMAIAAGMRNGTD